MLSGPQSPMGGDDFASLVADVADALGDIVPTWRSRLATAIADWHGRGFQTAVLERALGLTAPPDVDAILATFERAAQQLAALEAEAITFDPTLAGLATFRDPTRVREAAALVGECRRRKLAEPTWYPDPEHWILEWPVAGDLLAGELA